MSMGWKAAPCRCEAHGEAKEGGGRLCGQLRVSSETGQPNKEAGEDKTRGDPKPLEMTSDVEKQPLLSTVAASDGASKPSPTKNPNAGNLFGASTTTLIILYYAACSSTMLVINKVGRQRGEEETVGVEGRIAPHQDTPVRK